MRYDKIIFCSSDCTYRAPAAAEILKKNISDNKHMDDVVVEAKGMVVLFPEPVNGKVLAISRSKGYDLDEYVAESLLETDFDIRHLVIVMTEDSKQKLYDTYTNAINVYAIKEFVGEQGDIDIPFGGNLADYGESFSELERIVKLMIAKLEELN